MAGPRSRARVSRRGTPRANRRRCHVSAEERIDFFVLGLVPVSGPGAWLTGSVRTREIANGRRMYVGKGPPENRISLKVSEAGAVSEKFPPTRRLIRSQLLAAILS